MLHHPGGRTKGNRARGPAAALVPGRRQPDVPVPEQVRRPTTAGTSGPSP